MATAHGYSPVRALVNTHGIRDPGRMRWDEAGAERQTRTLLAMAVPARGWHSPRREHCLAADRQCHCRRGTARAPARVPSSSWTQRRSARRRAAAGRRTAVCRAPRWPGACTAAVRCTARTRRGCPWGSTPPALPLTPDVQGFPVMPPGRALRPRDPCVPLQGRVLFAALRRNSPRAMRRSQRANHVVRTHEVCRERTRISSVATESGTPSHKPGGAP
jgi:hypothetical protein